mmetsp:Transcript_46289/g.144991  ORF Transcript_46289/g.144991 Transcript_46289/m.144991 type:complete len:771 (+) Transcript_46289:757-3069(+)
MDDGQVVDVPAVGRKDRLDGRARQDGGAPKTGTLGKRAPADEVEAAAAAPQLLLQTRRPLRQVREPAAQEAALEEGRRRARRVVVLQVAKRMAHHRGLQRALSAAVAAGPRAADLEDELPAIGKASGHGAQRPLAVHEKRHVHDGATVVVAHRRRVGPAAGDVYARRGLRDDPPLRDADAGGHLDLDELGAGGHGPKDHDLGGRLVVPRGADERDGAARDPLRAQFPHGPDGVAAGAGIPGEHRQRGLPLRIPSGARSQPTLRAAKGRKHLRNLRQGPRDDVHGRLVRRSDFVKHLEQAPPLAADLVLQDVPQGHVAVVDQQLPRTDPVRLGDEGVLPLQLGRDVRDGVRLADRDPAGAPPDLDPLPAPEVQLRSGEAARLLPPTGGELDPHEGERAGPGTGDHGEEAGGVQRPPRRGRAIVPEVSGGDAGEPQELLPGEAHEGAASQVAGGPVVRVHGHQTEGAGLAAELASLRARDAGAQQAQLLQEEARRHLQALEALEPTADAAGADLAAVHRAALDDGAGSHPTLCEHAAQDARGGIGAASAVLAVLHALLASTRAAAIPFEHGDELGILLRRLHGQALRGVAGLQRDDAEIDVPVEQLCELPPQHPVHGRTAGCGRTASVRARGLPRGLRHQAGHQIEEEREAPWLRSVVDAVVRAGLERRVDGQVEEANGGRLIEEDHPGDLGHPRLRRQASGLRGELNGSQLVCAGLEQHPAHRAILGQIVGGVPPSDGLDGKRQPEGGCRRPALAGRPPRHCAELLREGLP